MKLEVKDNCPLNNFQPCQKLNCAWFIQLRGVHPQTGQEFDEWGCSMAIMPLLMVENSQQQRQTGAAVESFRNEMVNANAKTLHIMGQPAPKLAEIPAQKPCGCTQEICFHNVSLKEPKWID